MWDMAAIRRLLCISESGHINCISGIVLHSSLWNFCSQESGGHWWNCDKMHNRKPIMKCEWELVTNWQCWKQITETSNGRLDRKKVTHCKSYSTAFIHWQYDLHVSILCSFWDLNWCWAPVMLCCWFKKSLNMCQVWNSWLSQLRYLLLIKYCSSISELTEPTNKWNLHSVIHRD